MEVTRELEAGYEQALVGINFSYNQGDEINYNLAKKLAHKQGGHNKFLESISVWLKIKAPRYWWSQFDTYRVGTSKQSESTMHTITRRKLNQDDFESSIPEVVLNELNEAIRNKDFKAIKNQLPEGFLQTRMVCTNYKVLQNIYKQRRKHKLREWTIFTANLIEQLNFPEFIREVK